MNASIRHIPVRKIILAQFLVAGFLVGMHFAGAALPERLGRLFDLDRETSLPTWYSTVLLFSVALCSLGIAKRTPGPGPDRRFWRFFGLVFGFLSLDEAACIHESLTVAWNVKWIYFYAPFAAVFFGICAVYLLKTGRRDLQRWILGGLLVYALGGLLGEAVSYWYRPLPAGWQQVEFAWEEGLEMLGSILVLAGGLREFNRLGTLRSGED